jgi:hypothetical protein
MPTSAYTAEDRASSLRDWVALDDASGVALVKHRYLEIQRRTGR